MTLIECIHATNAASNSDDLIGIFMQFIKNYGFENFIMGEVSVDSLQEKKDNFGALASYPMEWLEHYKLKGYFDHDPVYQATKNSAAPFLWKDVCQNLSEKSSTVMNEAGEFNLVSGIGISVCLAHGKKIGIGISSSEKELNYDKNTISTLQAASNQLVYAFNDFIEHPKDNCTDEPLTNREREVLLWVAQGKIKSDIADILSVSESCIKRHCENIHRKLKVNSLVQAVVKAIRKGII